MPDKKLSELTQFGRYLRKRKLSDADAAAALEFTRSYINMLATGACTPGLHAAHKIWRWSKGEVTFQGWIH